MVSFRIVDLVTACACANALQSLTSMWHCAHSRHRIGLPTYVITALQLCKLKQYARRLGRPAIPCLSAVVTFEGRTATGNLKLGPASYCSDLQITKDPLDSMRDPCNLYSLQCSVSSVMDRHSQFVCALLEYLLACSHL